MSKKVITCVVLVLLVATVFITTGNSKTKLAGTWYYVSEPDDSIVINKTGSAEIDIGNEGTVSYTYAYSKGEITFYPVISLLYDVKTYKVKIKGDKMYLTAANGETEELRNSYDKAYEEYSKLYSDEIIRESEEEEAFKEYIRDLGQESTKPKLRQAEAYLESQGYYSYELDFWTDSSDDGLLIETDYPICMYVFYVWKDDGEYKATIEYSYVNGEWIILNGGFYVE